MTDPKAQHWRSGVYRSARADEALQAARACDLRVARIRLAGRDGKPALLRAFAAALEFPVWFGHNWDALEDCLTDLSWHPPGGHLILIEGSSRLARDDLGVLCDVLASAAEYWAERGTAFYAVLVAGPDALPELGGASAP